MDPQRLPPPRVPSPIRDPDTVVVPSTQPRANTTGEDSEAQRLQLATTPPKTPPRSTSTAPLSPGSVEKQEENDPFDTPERQASVQHHGTGIDAPLPSARLAGEYQGFRRPRTTDTHVSMARRSAIDWIVPVEEKPIRRLSARERLQPTLDVAKKEKDKFENKARMTGYALNIAIGLQVLLGSLTTGLSAVAVSSGKQTAVTTTLLGALATMVASYLARARGSNEPELSIARTKDLEQFIRQCEIFQMDKGNEMGDKFDAELAGLRTRFEELLGNTGNSERKLASI